ncbi:MAG: hypothetical protein EOO12_01970 [Chitinophagaceae bacterium]|nr:MAG: hypothetical protein EOO12_01970 [Chitinophagaceae bacterium]
MKKLTLLPFPQEHLHWMDQSDAIREMIDHNKKRNEALKDGRLERWLQRKAALEAEIAPIPEAVRTFPLSQAIEWVRKNEPLLKDLADWEERVQQEKNGYGWQYGTGATKNWKLGELKKRQDAVSAHLALKPEGLDELLEPAQRYRSLAQELRSLNHDLSELEGLLQKEISDIPVPLLPAHVALMNSSIAAMEAEGWELDRYELLATELFVDTTRYKCYSGVLFTWKKT